MYIARLICSDADCGEEITAESATLEELESLICDCGCALVIVAWPDAALSHDTSAGASRRPRPGRRRAARAPTR